MAVSYNTASMARLHILVRSRARKSRISGARFYLLLFSAGFYEILIKFQGSISRIVNDGTLQRFSTPQLVPLALFFLLFLSFSSFISRTYLDSSKAYFRVYTALIHQKIPRYTRRVDSSTGIGRLIWDNHLNSWFFFIFPFTHNLHFSYLSSILYLVVFPFLSFLRSCATTGYYVYLSL